MVILTAPLNWDRHCKVGRKPWLTFHVVWSLPTVSTKHGFWPRSSLCGGIALSGKTRRLSRIRNDLVTPRSNSKPACSGERVTWSEPTSRRSARRSRCRMHIAAQDLFGNSRKSLVRWYSRWARTFPTAGLPLAGSRIRERCPIAGAKEKQAKVILAARIIAVFDDRARTVCKNHQLRSAAWRFC